MLDAVDADGGDGRAREGAQEHAAQGVAEGDAEAGRQRRGDDAGVVAGIAGLFDLDPGLFDLLDG